MSQSLTSLFPRGIEWETRGLAPPLVGVDKQALDGTFYRIRLVNPNGGSHVKAPVKHKFKTQWATRGQVQALKNAMADPSQTYSYNGYTFVAPQAPSVISSPVIGEGQFEDTATSSNLDLLNVEFELELLPS